MSTPPRHAPAGEPWLCPRIAPPARESAPSRPEPSIILRALTRFACAIQRRRERARNRRQYALLHALDAHTLRDIGFILDRDVAPPLRGPGAPARLDVFLESHGCDASARQSCRSRHSGKCIAAPMKEFSHVPV